MNGLTGEEKKKSKANQNIPSNCLYYFFLLEIKKPTHDVTLSCQAGLLTYNKAQTLTQVFATVRTYDCLSAAWTTQ